MAYHIKRGEEVEEALRRLADDQLETALEEIASDTLPFAEKVHQVRKRCKKLRGLLRLVRKSFDGYGDENETFRDAARLLSEVRDAGSLIETYDALTGHFDAQIDRRAFAQIRARLTRDANEIRDLPETAERMEEVRQTLLAARARVPGWRLDDAGFDAVEGGIAKTYKRARKRMAAAWADPTDEAMHDWRKRVKYHWYHARLLRGIWPRMMQAHKDAADDLSDLLGDHHDLAVLDQRLGETPGDFGSETDVEAFRALLQRRKTVLEDRAFHLGRRLLAERKTAIVARWNGYWTHWQAGDGRRGEPIQKV